MRLVALLVSTTVLALSSIASLALTPLTAPARAASSGCSLYSSLHGSDSARVLRSRQRRHHGHPGSAGNPYRSVSKLVARLRARMTGCLDNGTYRLRGELAFRHSGRSGAPITLRSTPGQHARLYGGLIYIPAGSSHVTLYDLSIDTRGVGQPGIQVMADSTALISDHITNESTASSCIILGNNDGWGAARSPIIWGNVIHNCGARADGDQDHAIYFDNVAYGHISANTIYGTSGFAIHLYPNAQHNDIVQNVIDSNRYGVVFGGSGSYRSSDNLVVGNVIGNTTRSYDVQSYWGGAPGSGNVLAGNCLYHGARGINDSPTGYRAVGNIVASPRFANAAHHVYKLMPGSRCLAALEMDTSANALAHWARLG
jgi:Periplasmic copper-binding protein (NosD)